MTLEDTGKIDLSGEDTFDFPSAPKATERAGITSADIDQVESKHPSEFSSLAYDTLSWDELMADIQAVYPDINEKNLAAYRKAMDGAFGGTFVVPKVTDGTIPDNAQLFVELYDSVIQGKPFLPWSKVKSFSSATERGLFSISQQGIFFQAGVDDDKKAKPFTREEARQIALIAMHNKDLLPPNAIKITGSNEERLLIKKEVEYLNSLLPASARFTIANADEIKEPALDEVDPMEFTAKTADLDGKVIPPADNALEELPESPTASSGAFRDWGSSGFDDPRDVAEKIATEPQDFGHARTRFEWADLPSEEDVAAVTPEPVESLDEPKPFEITDEPAEPKSGTNADFTGAAEGVPTGETLFQRMARISRERDTKGPGPNGP